MSNKQRVLNKVKELVEAGNICYPKAKVDYDNIEIRFSLRGSSTAGTAFVDNGNNYMRLKFHPKLMDKDVDGYIEQVVAHEVAHIFQKRLYPHSQSHGREFKAIARTLGDNGLSYHTLDVKGVGMPKKRFVYSCPTCNKEYQLTTYRHNLQQSFERNGAGRYTICSKCRTRLNWTGQQKTIY